MRLRSVWAILATSLLASQAPAVVIDDFSAGPLTAGPEIVDLDLNQDGLSTARVIGGQRDWFMLYGGSVSVDAAAGSLTLDHDRGFFEVAILRYGKVLSTSEAVSLNADFTIDGHSQITLRMNRTTAGNSANASLPAYARLTLVTGMGTPALAGHGISVRPAVSDNSFVVQFPFSEFSNVDLTGVDGIDLSFFFEDFASFEIDDISTSHGLPGDYNLDGTVNAADYTVWRGRVGQTTLPNRNPAASGEIGQADYDFWKAHFGETFPAAAATSHWKSATVPEPTALALFGTLLISTVAIRLRFSYR
jgi:hypothetical protein